MRRRPQSLQTADATASAARPLCEELRKKKSGRAPQNPKAVNTLRMAEHSGGKTTSSGDGGTREFDGRGTSPSEPALGATTGPPRKRARSGITSQSGLADSAGAGALSAEVLTQSAEFRAAVREAVAEEVSRAVREDVMPTFEIVLKGITKLKNKIRDREKRIRFAVHSSRAELRSEMDRRLQRREEMIEQRVEGAISEMKEELEDHVAEMFNDVETSIGRVRHARPPSVRPSDKKADAYIHVPDRSALATPTVHSLAGTGTAGTIGAAGPVGPGGISSEEDDDETNSDANSDSNLRPSFVNGTGVQDSALRTVVIKRMFRGGSSVDTGASSTNGVSGRPTASEAAQHIFMTGEHDTFRTVAAMFGMDEIDVVHRYRRRYMVASKTALERPWTLLQKLTEIPVVLSGDRTMNHKVLLKDVELKDSALQYKPTGETLKSMSNIVEAGLRSADSVKDLYRNNFRVLKATVGRLVLGDHGDARRLKMPDLSKLLFAYAKCARVCPKCRSVSAIIATDDSGKTVLPRIEPARFCQQCGEAWVSHQNINARSSTATDLWQLELERNLRPNNDQLSLRALTPLPLRGQDGRVPPQGTRRFALQFIEPYFPLLEVQLPPNYGTDPECEANFQIKRGLSQWHDAHLKRLEIELRAVIENNRSKGKIKTARVHVVVFLLRSILKIMQQAQQRRVGQAAGPHQRQHAVTAPKETAPAALENRSSQSVTRPDQ